MCFSGSRTTNVKRLPGGEERYLIFYSLHKGNLSIASGTENAEFNGKIRVSNGTEEAYMGLFRVVRSPEHRERASCYTPLTAWLNAISSCCRCCGWWALNDASFYTNWRHRRPRRQIAAAIRTTSVCQPLGASEWQQCANDYYRPPGAKQYCIYHRHVQEPGS